MGFCILNTLHFIDNDESYYCYCQDNQKCKMCMLPIFFSNFEKETEKNIFGYNFLFWYYTKLCKELIQLFDHKKECIKCFQGEYGFKGRGSYTGEYWSVLLSGSIRCNKKIQVDRLKLEKLLLPPEYWEETIDLTCDEISWHFP